MIVDMRKNLRVKGQHMCLMIRRSQTILLVVALLLPATYTAAMGFFDIDREKMLEFLKEQCKRYEVTSKEGEIDIEDLLSWGSILQTRSILETDLVEKESVLKQACEKFAKAIILDANRDNIWSSWGNTLSRLAELEQGPQEKQALLQSACNKFQKATELQPKKVINWHCWGIALKKLADTKKDQKDKQTLLNAACDKFEEALKYDETNADIWIDWGGALYVLSHIEQDLEKRNALLEKAIECCKQSLGGNNSSSYWFACRLAAARIWEKAFAELEENFTETVSHWRHLKSNRDWDPVRNDSRYQALRQKVLEELMIQKEKSLKKYEEDITRFDNDESPKHKLVYALGSKASILEYTERFEEAIKVYDEIVERFGNDENNRQSSEVGEALLRKAGIFEEMENFEEAIKVYDVVLATFDRQENIGNYVGSALRRKKQCLVKLENQPPGK